MSSITFRSDQDPSKLTLNELTFPSEGTAQKHPQYYSNNQHSATIKRKLLQEQPHEGQQCKQAPGNTAQYSKPPSSLTFNRELLHQMRTAIHTQQTSSYHSKPTPNITYQSVEFGTIPYVPFKIELPQKQSNAKQGGSAPSPLSVDQSAQHQLVFQEMKPILPAQKINTLRKEMVDFYKENRNINFEYRQAKFIKLFGAKPYHPHLNI